MDFLSDERREAIKHVIGDVLLGPAGVEEIDGHFRVVRLAVTKRNGWLDGRIRGSWCEAEKLLTKLQEKWSLTEK